MKKSTPAQFAIRILIYCLGLMLIAFGVALSVNSDLGVSPVNSLPYVISVILGKPMGPIVTINFCLYIVLQAIILRREFRLINLTQIIFSTLFGYFVDFAKLMVGDFVLPGYFGRLVMLAVSIVVIALGVLLYMDVQLMPMPMEGLSSTIAIKMNKPFPTMKIVIDTLVMLVSLVLSLVFLRRLDGIREGTIISALTIGAVVSILKKPISPWVQKICFGKA